MSVFCFYHCDKNVKIFYVNFPENCPICGQNTNNSPVWIPPCRVPSPLVIDTRFSPFSVVVRPTEGGFLESYTTDSNLHIGITSSQGEVYDFNENGVNIGTIGWTQCLAVKLPDVCSSEIWDQKLDQFSQQQNWYKHRYHADQLNCYSFVIGFFHYVGLANNNVNFSSKITFCENKLLPETTRVAEYVSLYRRLKLVNTVCEVKTSGHLVL